MKEIEERYDRAQQRKELAELSKGAIHTLREKGKTLVSSGGPSR